MQTRHRRRTQRFAVCLWLCLANSRLWAEPGKLLVEVEDVNDHPVRGIEIGIKGFGGSRLTGSDGKALLSLASDTRETDWVLLQLLHSPPGKDFVMVSPWDSRVQVPSFKNKAENFVLVVVVQSGDRAALQNGNVLAALTAKINQNDRSQSPKWDSRTALTLVATQYGLRPDDLDEAIREWGAKTNDPYEAGLAALYERHYPKASAQLQDSLRHRQEDLRRDQKAMIVDVRKIADAAFFLGVSLFGEGRYREGITAYEECLRFRPNDAAVLNNIAMCFYGAGIYISAEPLFRRALEIDEKALGPNHANVSTDLGNLGSLLRNKGDYTAAELLFNRALAMDKARGLGQSDVVATDLTNIGSLLEVKGNYAAAELLYRQALDSTRKRRPQTMTPWQANSTILAMCEWRRVTMRPPSRSFATRLQSTRKR